MFPKNIQYYKFSAYGFLKNLRFFEPFFILYFLSQGLDYLQIGTLYAFREGAINLLEIPTGFLADSWGRKKTMLLSFIAYITAFLMFHYFESFGVMLGAMFFYAFGDACRTGTHKAMIFDYLKIKGWSSYGSAYYGRTRGWSQRGSALSALLGGLLVFFDGDYSRIFLYSIIPYLLDFFLIASYPPFLDRPSQKRSTRFLLPDSLGNLKRNYRKIGSISVYAGYYKAVKDYLQPVLQGAAVALPFMVDAPPRKREALLIAGVYTLIYLLTSRASSQAGQVHKRFPDTSRFLFYSLLVGSVLGGGAALFLYWDLPWITALFFLLIFVLENIRKPVGISYLGDSTDEAVLSTVLSLESQGETLWSAFFALVIGGVAYTLGLPVALAVVAVALIGASLLFRGKPQLQGFISEDENRG